MNVLRRFLTGLWGTHAPADQPDPTHPRPPCVGCLDDPGAAQAATLMRHTAAGMLAGMGRAPNTPPGRYTRAGTAAPQAFKTLREDKSVPPVRDSFPYLPGPDVSVE